MDATSSEAIEKLEANQPTLPHRTPEAFLAPDLLPDTPLVRIRPRPRWVSLDLRDLWAYRELLYFLTRRDVKVCRKQTLLGADRTVIQPLQTMLAFTLVFWRIVGDSSDCVPNSATLCQADAHARTVSRGGGAI